MASAWKVGLLVVMFAAMVLGAYAVLQRSVFAKETHEYYVRFEDAGGLTSGARVLLSGVQVGLVEEVGIGEDGRPVATVAIERDYRIPAGSDAVLPTSFISIGDRQIEITPPQVVESYLSPGDTLDGRLKSPLESFVPESGETVAELNRTLVAVRKLLEDQELKGGVKELMASATQTSDRFGKLAGRMDGLLARTTPALDTLMASATASLQNLEAVSVQVRRLAEDGQLEGQTKDLLEQMNAAVAKGTQLVENLNALVVDPQLQGDLRAMAANVKTMSDSGTRIAANAEVISANGITISAETTELLRKANTLADEVQDLLETFRGTLGRIGTQGKSLADSIQASAELTQESNPGHTRIDLNARVPFGGNTVMVGLYDAFEANKLNVMLEKTLNPRLDFRYGVYASKPGLGVQYQVAPRFSLRSELFGLNDPQFDVRATYDFGGGIQGWVGLERIFERNAPSIGIGTRK